MVNLYSEAILQLSGYQKLNNTEYYIIFWTIKVNICLFNMWHPHNAPRIVKAANLQW
jgi:hypothetical protein